MILHSVDAGDFKLDGGAMFGVVPKILWSKKIAADDLNLCSWKMRCLLVEIDNRLILIDTGMGNKQSEKWQSYYYKHGDGDLIGSIRSKGYHENQVTDVILSHLHFDHAGGAVTRRNETDLVPTFPNAKYWTHSDHWAWAVNPNEREKATFLRENLLPLKESGVLFFVDGPKNDLPQEVKLLTANGHTEKMLMPLISFHEQQILFVADTIPSHAHIHVPWCMGYDVRPLVTMEEKQNILSKSVKEDWILFFDHDPFYSCCKVQETEKGYLAKELGELKDFF